MMMAALTRFVRRLVNVLRPWHAEDDLARELASHVRLLEDEYRRRGMSVDEARRAARLALGGVDQAKEQHRTARSRGWTMRGAICCTPRARLPAMSGSAWPLC
jgi:hypothetical protein